MFSVFENWGAEEDFGPQMEEVIGEWRRLRKELYDLNCSPNIIRVTKSRIKR
jgi:hypothetical protein